MQSGCRGPPAAYRRRFRLLAGREPTYCIIKPCLFALRISRQVCDTFVNFGEPEADFCFPDHEIQFIESSQLNDDLKPKAALADMSEGKSGQKGLSLLVEPKLSMSGAQHTHKTSLHSEASPQQASAIAAAACGDVAKLASAISNGVELSSAADEVCSLLPLN